MEFGGSNGSKASKNTYERSHSYSELLDYSVDVDQDADTKKELEQSKKYSRSNHDQQRRPSWLGEVKLKPVARSNNNRQSRSLGCKTTTGTTKTCTIKKPAPNAGVLESAPWNSKIVVAGKENASENQSVDAPSNKPSVTVAVDSGNKTKRVLQVKAMFESDSQKKYDFDTPSPLYANQKKSWNSYQGEQLTKQRQQQRRHSSFNSPTSWQLTTTKKKKKSSLPKPYQTAAMMSATTITNDNSSHESIINNNMKKKNDDHHRSSGPLNEQQGKMVTRTTVPSWKQKLLEKNKSNKFKTPSQHESKENDVATCEGGPLLRDQVQQDLIERELYKTSVETPSPSKTLSYQEFVKEQQQKNISSLLATPVQEPSSEGSPELLPSAVVQGEKPDVSETVVEEDAIIWNEVGTTEVDSLEINGDGCNELKDKDDEGGRTDPVDQPRVEDDLIENGVVAQRKGQEEARIAEEKRIKADAAARLKAKSEAHLAEERRLAEEEKAQAKEETRKRLAEESRVKAEEEHRIAKEQRLAQEAKVKAENVDRIAKEEVNVIEEARLAVLIQSWWRMEKQRKQFRTAREAATTLQNRRRLLVSSRQSTSAARIQSLYRRFAQEARLRAGAVLRLAEEKSFVDKVRDAEGQQQTKEVPKEKSAFLPEDNKESLGDETTGPAQNGELQQELVKKLQSLRELKSSPSLDIREGGAVRDSQFNTIELAGGGDGELGSGDISGTQNYGNNEGGAGESLPGDDSYDEFTIDDDETFETIDTVDTVETLEEDDENFDNCDLSDLVEEEESILDDQFTCQPPSELLDGRSKSAEETVHTEEVFLCETNKDGLEDLELLPSPTSVFGFDEVSTDGSSCIGEKIDKARNAEESIDDSVEESIFVTSSDEHEATMLQVAGETTNETVTNEKSSNTISLMFEAIMEQLSYPQEEEESGRKTPRTSNTARNDDEAKDGLDNDGAEGDGMSTKGDKVDKIEPVVSSIATKKQISGPSFAVPGVGAAMNVFSSTATFFFCRTSCVEGKELTVTSTAKCPIEQEAAIGTVSHESDREDAVEVGSEEPKEDERNISVVDIFLPETGQQDEDLVKSDDLIERKSFNAATDAVSEERESHTVPALNNEYPSGLSLLMSNMELGALLDEQNEGTIIVEPVKEERPIGSTMLFDLATSVLLVGSILYLWATCWQGTSQMQKLKIVVPALDYLPMAFTLLFCAVGQIFSPATYVDADATSTLRANNTVASVAIRLVFAGSLVGLWILYLSELSSSERSAVVSSSLNYIPMLSVLFLSTEDDASSAIGGSQPKVDAREVTSRASSWSTMKKSLGNFATSPVTLVCSFLGGLALCLGCYQDISPILKESMWVQALQYLPRAVCVLVFLGGVIRNGKKNFANSRHVTATTVAVKAICTGVIVVMWSWVFLSTLAPEIQQIVISRALESMWLPLISIAFFRGNDEQAHVEPEGAAPVYEVSGPRSSEKPTQERHLSTKSNASYGDTAIHVLLAIAMILWVMCWTVMPESKAIAISSNVLLGGYFVHLLT